MINYTAIWKRLNLPFTRLRILDNLRAAGTPIPTNDIWIAAVTFQHGYQLLSKDRHFQSIPGLVHFQA